MIQPSVFYCLSVDVINSRAVGGPLVEDRRTLSRVNWPGGPGARWPLSIVAGPSRQPKGAESDAVLTALGQRVPGLRSPQQHLAGSPRPVCMTALLLPLSWAVVGNRARSAPTVTIDGTECIPSEAQRVVDLRVR